MDRRTDTLTDICNYIVASLLKYQIKSVCILIDLKGFIKAMITYSTIAITIDGINTFKLKQLSAKMKKNEFLTKKCVYSVYFHRKL